MMKRTTLVTCTIAAACLPAPVLMGQSESLSPRSTHAETSISTHADSDHGCMLLCGGSLLPQTILEAFHERGGGVQGQVLGSGSVYLVRSQSNKDFSHSMSAGQVGLVPMQLEGLKTSRHKSGSRLPIDRWNRIVTRTNNAEFAEAKNE
jgi:hypothetical protein